MPPQKGFKIAFIHPDLGIGGAERLVVDAAIGLQNKGHDVTIYTSHCDRTHCFEEISDGTLKVIVLGDHLPNQIYGRFSIFCATLRQLYLTLSLITSKSVNKYDLFIVDQLSTCIPFLEIFSKTLFYCHFPDQLLARRESFLKKIYRLPFDLIEQFTTGSADCIVVNSNFTKSIFYKTFRFLKKDSIDVDVIYPCVSLVKDSYDKKDLDFYNEYLKKGISVEGGAFLLSINRYERKKDIELAIKAYAAVKNSDNLKLYICGGYDNRVDENVAYLKELQEIATNLKLSYVTVHYDDMDKTTLSELTMKPYKIIFLTSISTSLKNILLENAKLLLYTPSNEHFGIVPLEAMKYGTPVLACNNGGPLESIEPGTTGWLKDPNDTLAWTEAIDECLSMGDGEYKAKFQKNGPIRVKKLFSRDSMTESFERNIEKFIYEPKRDMTTFGFYLFALINFIVFIVVQAICEGVNKYFIYGFMSVFNLFFLRHIVWSAYWILFGGLVYFRGHIED
ncbi:related to Alpha-1,3/1,6-mannosyltransferase ALG2 [Saccharomycodes ludwigii]|uniref:Alpha-1,3/1,6-mannosyltransferase ALG2 n=1 Tax=Saccharomycodes ludwigii TaxID=36035 RepID=A0A376B4V0_9ASCO|nr:hypothetical protein SCDLUD_001106 [Saccharomycodes ludwigii]KAH3903466.1 hypothetical protein SCDLUD_001106 [Saccharomycodes ludwigii]SSD59504.1 related to Alpha-1,3/1,6-mannosyltransferase ALG2 [Saccharomycodes ludwigii]